MTDSFLPPFIQYGFTVDARREIPRLFNQVHGTDLIELPLPESSQDPSHGLPLPEADGAYTFHSGVRTYIFTADCVPLLFFSDRYENPIAAIHAGWRGILQGIGQKVCQTLIPSLFSDWHVVVGPCIRSCCFEVKGDFLQCFSDAWGSATYPHIHSRGNRSYFDLVAFLIETQLNSFPVNNIHLTSASCTFCSSDRFPSFRREKNRNISLCSWILKSPLEKEVP